MTKAARDVENLVQALRSSLVDGAGRSRARLRHLIENPEGIGNTRHTEVEGTWCDARGPVAKIEDGTVTLLPGRDALALSVAPRPGPNACFSLEFNTVDEHWEGLFTRGGQLIQWASGDIWHRPAGQA